MDSERAPDQPAGVAAKATTRVDDAHLLAALRAGSEEAFAIMIDRYHASLVRIATLFVADTGLAEEIAQETWLAVLRGLDRFAERSTFRTWLFGILANQARRRGRRERRVIPFSALTRPPRGEEPAVDPDRFYPPGAADAGHWSSPPADWDAPESVVLSRETRREIERAIADLPPNQRAVITLRDVEGWAADEVCKVLRLSATNQRVLLHRARSRVRRELERHLGEGPRA